MADISKEAFMERNNRRQQSPTMKKGRYLLWQTRFLCTSMKWPRNCGLSVLYAYKLIRQMNKELEKTGCITISGRIDRKFFHEKFYGTRTKTDRKGDNLWQRFRTGKTAPGMCSSATPTGRVSASKNSSGALPPSGKLWNGNESS